MDLHGIDLNLLVAFDALMAERNVTRAGVRISRSQPAMSAALARLRVLLKDELFVRGTEGLRPTPRALELAEPLGNALAQIQKTLAFSDGFNPATSSLVFSIGLSEHPEMILLPRLYRRLARLAPDITLRVRAVHERDDAIDLLDSGEVDMTVSIPVPKVPRILIEPLFTERFVCVMRHDHPDAETPLTLDRFLSLSHLLVSPEGDQVGLVDTQLALLGKSRRLGLSTPHLFAAPAVIASSNMIATLMAGAIQASPSRHLLRWFDPPIALDPVPFVLHWHRRNDRHLAQRWIRQQILEVGREIDNGTACEIGNDDGGVMNRPGCPGD